MDFHLTEEQKMVRKTIREFAEGELASGARERDEKSEFPTEAVKKLGELGFCGICTPTEYGGAGLDHVSYAIILEELARVDASVSVIMSVTNTLAGHPLLEFGSEEQKKKYTVPLAKGEALGAFSLSEPHAGSDASNLLCMAVREGDEYVIDGTKNFVTSGSTADIIILFAVTAKKQRHKGISCFVIETDKPGFTVSKVEKKLGIRSSDTAEIFFDGYRVPAENRIGEEGDGFRIAMNTLDGGRIGIGAQALGIAQAALEKSLTYSNEREQFGKKIRQFEAVQFMISEMAVEIEAARLLLYRAAWMQDQGERYGTDAAMAKLYASRIAMMAANHAVQIHGGYGYMREYEVERLMRDAKITEIYEGTSEVQKIVIAREYMKRYALN